MRSCEVFEVAAIPARMLHSGGSGRGHETLEPDDEEYFGPQAEALWLLSATLGT